MRSVQLLVMLVLIPALARCQTRDDLGRLRAATGIDWISTTPWKLDDPEWSCVHRMSYEWRVALQPGSQNLVITEGPFSHADRRQKVVALNGGKLLGTNYGEFGGDVRWITTQRDTTVLVGDNLVQFLTHGDSVYVLTGLAHLSSSTGELWRLSRRDKTWRVERLVDLQDAPQTAMLEPTRATIVGLHRLTTVILADTQATHWAYGGWYASYANSVVRVGNGEVYIGLRQGIARLTPTRTGYDAVWFVPRARSDSLHEGCK